MTNKSWMKITANIICLAFVAIILFSSVHGAIAAPKQLYGKSIVITWAEERVQKLPSSTNLDYTPVHGELSIYISDIGRVFHRLTMTVMGRGSVRSGSSDQGGGTASDRRARDITIQGRSLVATIQQIGGARRIVANFNDGFTGCSARVIHGKEAGASKIVIRDLINPGRAIEIYSSRATNEACSIKATNVFGAQ